jgi:hypothetical protein
MGYCVRLNKTAEAHWKRQRSKSRLETQFQRTGYDEHDDDELYDTARSVKRQGSCKERKKERRAASLRQDKSGSAESVRRCLEASRIQTSKALLPVLKQSEREPQTSVVRFISVCALHSPPKA